MNQNNTGPRIHYLALLILSAALAACSSTGLSNFTPQHSDAVSTLLEQAENAKQSGNFISAENSIERALRIEPENAFIWFKLGELNCDIGNFYDCENIALKAKRLSRSGALTRQLDALLARSQNTR